MDDIHYDAIFGKLSEISTKLDSIQATSKVKEVLPVNLETNQTVSKEDVELLIRTHATHLGKFVEKTHQFEVGLYNKLITSILDLKNQVKALPVPEKISLESMMEVFPKPKKITICGFELLRISVIIFVLSLIAFFSLTLNIKQMDDYRTLKSKYSGQTEYILQMETNENHPSAKKNNLNKN
ncbi:hypothetical protein EZS27_020261 [termite gut metagenome]|uniref:Uncharacterized protein n=1 Tax=termite gut metagenome TaxID=433724 RepID=A0A5J4RBF0_9ZZZZ